MGLRHMVSAAALAVSIAVPAQSFAGAADLDTSFANQGRIAIGVYSFGQGVVVQPDGKIVLAAEVFGEFCAARFGTNGFLDPSFGSGGITAGAFPTISSGPTGVGLQSDGSIVVSGIAYSATNHMDFAART